MRAATLEDAQLIADLVNDVDLVDTGSADYNAGEVAEDLEAVVDLTTDSWLALDGDRLLAYCVIWNGAHNGKIDIDHYVRREAIPAGAALIDLAVARVAQAAAEDGLAEAQVHLYLPPGSALTAAALPDRDWRVVRRYHVLTRPVSVEHDPVPEPLPWLTLRTVASEADQRIAYELLEAAFAGQFDHPPRTYEVWREQVSADKLDWSLVWIASLAGAADGAVAGAGAAEGTVAGAEGAEPVDVAALLARNNRDTMGWVRSLGVLDSVRGRGIGSHLLKTAFATFAQLGRDTVGLGVDTENPTGAPRLYAGLGMTLHFAADTWEIDVPAAGRA